MKKTNKTYYGSWVIRERHLQQDIWGNGRVGSVGPTGWKCPKCGLTVLYNRDKKKKKQEFILYKGGKCLFATQYEDRKEIKSKFDWDFIIIFSPFLAILGFLLLAYFSTV